MKRIGIDLGGTNIAAGVVDENGKILGKASIKTDLPASADSIADRMFLAAEEACRAANTGLSEISAVGAGVPGAVDPRTGTVSFSNNLGFVDVPLGEMLSCRFKKECFIENDANAAALGEFKAGAGKGTENFILVTLGTGIGGGIIIGGKIYSGGNFAGGELGHTVLIKDGEPCSCGRKGCFEVYASASALVKQAKEEMKNAPESILWKLGGKNAGNLGGREIFEAYRSGDPAAKTVVKRYSGYLAEGLSDIVNIFQPDMLCIGGGVSGAGELLLAPVRETVLKNDYARNCKRRVKIAAAALGNDAGIIGAAFLGLNAK